MIELTSTNGEQLYLHHKHFEKMTRTADTHLLMVNGNTYAVREEPAEIIEKIVAWNLRNRAGSN